MIAVKTIAKNLKDYLLKSKKKTYVLGISTGIDSSVCYFICKKYDIPVKAVYLPNRFLKKENELIKKYFKDAKIIELDKILEKLILDLDIKGKIRKANAIARMRMLVLYDMAYKYNGLVLGTSNKDEWQLGYFTKYGDGAADVFPLIKLTKKEIYEIAEKLKIPKQIINKKPSAGLWKGQTDEKELGFDYLSARKVLDLIGKSEKQISKKTGIKLEVVHKIIERYENTKHKRKII